MRKLSFQVQVLSPVIVSSSAANVDLSSHSYIPGSAFRGILANHFDKLNDFAETLLFSGDVIFTPAYPLQEEVYYPMPFCMYEDRNQKESILYNLAKIGTLEDSGFKRKKGGFINSKGNVYFTQKEAYVKTAIDRASATALESNLFSYEAISPGQEFVFHVFLTDKVSDKLEETLVSLLEGDAYVGRSRSAEFGKVHIKKYIDSANQANFAGKDYIAYVLSPVVPKMQLPGSPIKVTGETLGLPEGHEITLAAIQMETVSHFNYYKQIRRDRTVQLLPRSVLRVSGEPPAEYIRAGSFAGEEGGILWVNPPFLQDETITVHSSSGDQDHKKWDFILQSYPKVKADRDFLQWLQSRRAESLPRHEYDKLLKEGMRIINAALLKADTLPTPSQWGQIRKAIEQAMDYQQIHAELFKENGFLRKGVQKAVWTQYVPVEGKEYLWEALHLAFSKMQPEQADFAAHKKLMLDLVNQLTKKAQEEKK
ncbi:MAG: hypothetical protein D6767_10910 [Candidatus Hydrogenedentota bacterium]|nr:MAG: hypothetical protein D6767_10910 [Candidatus Hydrogenedentota bacterium]